LHSGVGWNVDRTVAMNGHAGAKRSAWAVALRVLKWVALGALGIVALTALYLLVIVIGAALGLWPISAR
jgi:hypothetical protein